MLPGAVDDADRDVGVECAAAVDEEVHRRTEATHVDSLHGEDTHGTAAAQTT
jgi:hypothetical protein